MLIDVSPSRIDLTGIRAGDRNEVGITIKAGGAPLDLTGATLRAMARHEPHASHALHATITEVDASKGQFILAWDGDQVRSLLGEADRWKGVWDLEAVEEGQTIPTTLAAGEFTAVMDVTRD
jgi:hypothetical protein